MHCREITANSENVADRILYEHYTSDLRSGYALYGDGKCCMPNYFSKFWENVENFTVRDDDVWVVSYPKTGTTWTQEMVWCIGNDLDFKGAKTNLPERFPFLEYASLFEYGKMQSNRRDVAFSDHMLDSVKQADQMNPPRFIKSHLPWTLLPKQIRTGAVTPKIVYVARNPKDTCVSYYHHCRLFENFNGSLDDFCELFLSDRTCYAPYWDHILTFWRKRNDPNILFIKYEDMKSNLGQAVDRVGRFLGKDLQENQVRVLCDHLSFESMKNNSAVNYEGSAAMKRRCGLSPEGGRFMRAGAVGDFKNHMSGEFIARFDEWTRRNLAGTDLEF